jgi:hypothetical protein
LNFFADDLQVFSRLPNASFEGLLGDSAFVQMVTDAGGSLTHKRFVGLILQAQLASNMNGAHYSALSLFTNTRTSTCLPS